MTAIEATFVGAQTLTPNGWSKESLAIQGGRIADRPCGQDIALPGYRILPGIVDLHGDGFERHLAPRRGLMRDLAEGLLSLDAELAASGITTAVLAQFWSWEGGMRGPAFARTLAEALDRTHPQLLTDMKLQLRLETHLIDDFDAVLAFVDEHHIGFVVFNDHLPHKALRAGKRPPRLVGQALKGGRSPEAHLALMQELAAQGDQVPGALDQLAAQLAARKVVMGSHDDPTPDHRMAMRARGVRIAEFPETMETVQAAHGAGDPVILGAPNVVRGGSHTGNLSALAAVSDGTCDALVSDYHYPSLFSAVSRLAPGRNDELAAAWSLVSEGPAQVMGWSDRGRLTPGARADLVILDPSGRIGATLCGGRIAHMRGATAHQILGA